MALDMNRLKNLDSELGGDSALLYANKITNELDIRILPPTERMGGVYFAERKLWWINNKPYLSNSTFGEDDVIQQEVDIAKTNKDADIQELLADDKKLKSSSDYLIPVLALNCQFGGKGEVISIKVDGGKGKLFVVGKMLLKAINKQVTSKFCQPDITDRVDGFNVLITKTGAGMKTEYGADAHRQSFEMDEKYYLAYPCPVEYLEEERVSDAYLRGIIRNFIYGERLPDESLKKQLNATAARRTAPVEEEAPKRSRMEAKVEEEPTTRRQAPKEDAPKADAPKRRNLLADLDDED